MQEIYYNGKIITMMETDGETAEANMPEAVLVENGRIRFVGELQELKRLLHNGRVKYYDLAGKCLMPAFIDSHSHFVMNGQMALCVDLSECTSFDDIVHALKDYIKKNHITNKNAVLGFGYDHNFLKEQRHPDKDVLDQASTTIPIFILHVSAHLGCANSMALQIAGITKKTADPKGGHIGRKDDGNEPSGYLEEAALGMVQAIVGKKIKKSIYKIIKRMQHTYLERGITTVQDGATTSADFQFLRMLGIFRILKVDVVAYPLMTSGGNDLMKKYGKKYENYRRHIKIGGYKLVLDGSPQGKTAWLSEPYVESGDYCGYAWLSDQVVEKYVSCAVKEQKQLLAHCNGDAASQQFLDTYEKVTEKLDYSKDLRPVMIHCQTVREDQLERMAKIPMIASFFVGHIWYWGEVHKKNLGVQRGNHISPIKSAISKGVKVNLHQDTPVTKPDMMHSVWCAVCRLGREGEIIGESEKISVYEALKAITIDAAYEYFEENEKGSIEVGKRADLVILDKSPLEVAAIDLKNINVLETIKDGKCLFSKISKG